VRILITCLYATSDSSYVNGSSEFDAVIDAYGAAKFLCLVERRGSTTPLACCSATWVAPAS
jgi:hypothetical protein